MLIRKTVEADLEQIGKIYENAKRFMRQTGNLEQWNSPKPNADTAREDMQKGIGYVLEDNGEILAVFMFSTKPDPTYDIVYGGAWLDDGPYGVIHRIAVKTQGLGLFGVCIDYCLKHCKSLRIDTHKDNAPMQRALLKRGFKYCGIIHLLNGDERLAYQKI